jgi:hypothetical protein
MRICRTAEKVRFVSESEMLVMFVILDGDGTARYISKWLKIM